MRRHSGRFLSRAARRSLGRYAIARRSKGAGTVVACRFLSRVAGAGIALCARWFEAIASVVLVGGMAIVFSLSQRVHGSLTRPVNPEHSFDRFRRAFSHVW